VDDILYFGCEGGTVLAISGKQDGKSEQAAMSRE
jgi:hypothetical protein